MARATGLAVAVVLLSPISPLVLVCVPLAVLLVAFHSGNSFALGLGALILAAAFVGVGRDPPPLWYAERAWALFLGGGFVVATLVLERGGVVIRSFGALAVALGAVLLSGLFRPVLLAELDWRVGNELGKAASTAYQWVGGGAWEDAAPAFREVLGIQTVVYPALLGLASMAALGVGWYVLTRLRGAGEALGPLREFRFSDQLIWILIGGLLLFLLPVGEPAARLGENFMVFMGGLYLLRGVAILAWVAAALVTSAWTGVLWVLAAFLLYPLVAGAALVLGLSDTWLDVRARLGGPGRGGE